MAASVKGALSVVGSGVLLVNSVRVSSIVSGEVMTITHGGPDGVAPYKVEALVRTKPTTGDPISVEHDPDGDDTSANTSEVRLYVPAGGSPDGAVVDLLFHFLAVGAGGV